MLVCLFVFVLFFVQHRKIDFLAKNLPNHNKAININKVTLKQKVKKTRGKEEEKKRKKMQRQLPFPSFA